MSDLSGTKINEITVYPRRFALKCKSTKKASGTVKRLKKFIQKMLHTTDSVYLSTDLNKRIWMRGQNESISKIRIRIERAPCLVNPEKRCVRVSLVDVNSFRNLQDIAVDE